MDFYSYPKVELRSEHQVGGVWVATEKVHGANFTVVTDGAEVRFGKRKAWLAPDEPFFGWQRLRAELTEAAFAAWRALGHPETLRLYGELFGGHYPHPAVAADASCQAVQTGVWYCPDIRFALFDVVVEPDRAFLSFAHVQAVAAGCGLRTVPVLARGSRAQLQGLPVRFQSRVPTALGLPTLRSNEAEGFVLKPDARLPPEARPVLKCKLPEFDEARFDQARPWACAASPRSPAAGTDDTNALIALACTLVNPPRLASARSKVGDGVPLTDEVVADVLVDLDAAFPDVMRTLSTEAQARLRSALAALV